MGRVTPGVETRKKFRRSWSSQSQSQLQTQTQSAPQQQSQNKNRKKRGDHNFLTENDIQGIVMLEILGVNDLRRIKNSAFPLNLSLTIPQTDCHPVLILAVHSVAHRLGHGPLRSHLLGKNVFKTHVIRYSLNSTWDEKLLFHVHAYTDCRKECTPLESLVTLQIHNILPWDKDKNCSLRCDL
jgi:hypothetical protein